MKCDRCGIERDLEHVCLDALKAEVSRLKLQNEVMHNALKEIAGSPSSYLWSTLTGIAREALETCGKKRKLPAPIPHGQPGHDHMNCM